MAAHRPIKGCIVRGRGVGVSLASVHGPLSIAAGTVVVEVLVGYSPVLPRRFPQKQLGARADFLHVKKKKKKCSTKQGRSFIL